MLRTPLAFALFCLFDIAASSLLAENSPAARPVYITTVGNVMWVERDIISVENFENWLTENAPRLSRDTPIVFSENCRRFLNSRFDLIRQAQKSFDHVYLVLWDEKNRDQPPLVLWPTHDDIAPILNDMRLRQQNQAFGKSVPQSTR